MYSLSIFFGTNPVPAQFLFKNKEKAEDARSKTTAFLPDATGFGIEDDFGQHGAFKHDAVIAVILEDMDLGEESRIQRGLSQARGQAKANERAKTDPILMRAMTQQRSPSMITPFSNGGFNQ
jgi:hypothetical protein